MVSTTRVARNPDRTRRRLLRAAIKLLAQPGFHAVSVDAIVDLAKVNKRMVYHYFGSKDALFEAALVEVDGRTESIEFHAVGLGRDPAEKLGGCGKAISRFWMMSRSSRACSSGRILKKGVTSRRRITC